MAFPAECRHVMLGVRMGKGWDSWGMPGPTRCSENTTSLTTNELPIGLYNEFHCAWNPHKWHINMKEKKKNSWNWTLEITQNYCSESIKKSSILFYRRGSPHRNQLNIYVFLWFFFIKVPRIGCIYLLHGPRPHLAELIRHQLPTKDLQPGSKDFGKNKK